MAKGDIVPFRGEFLKRAFPVAASQSFEEGDAVIMTAGGALNEAADGPAAVLGICADPPTNALHSTGLVLGGTAAAAGTLVGVYIPTPEQQFRSNNFTVGGTTTVPTQGNAINEAAGLALSGGTWSVDTSEANKVVMIDDVLDANGNSITDPNLLVGAGTTVVFHFT